MNSARLRSVEDGLTGIAKKVLGALSFAEFKTQHEIGAELARQGHRADRNIISGCLQSLTRSGLVREWEGRYRRIQFEDKKPMNSVIAMPVPARQTKETPADVPAIIKPQDLPERMSSVASVLRSAALEIDAIAIAMIDREQDKAKEMEKLHQLKALLASIGGAA
jgi:hypothetical protein